MAAIFRDHLLQHQVAFITGGGSGINLRIAERFAEHGAKVCLMGRTQAKLDAAVAGIASAGGTAMAVAGDVREYPTVAAALAKARETWGEVDILLCGAAGTVPA